MNGSEEGVNSPTLSQLGQRFVGGTIWMSASQVAAYGVSFGANIALARLLSPDDFGVFGLGLSILALVYILSSWSFSIAIIQASEIDQRSFDTAYTLSLVLGITLFILVAVISFLLQDYYSSRVLQILVILSLFRFADLLSNCYSATLQRDLRFRGVALVQVVARIASVIVAVALAWGGFGVWSLVCKVAVSTIVSFFGIRLLSAWRFHWHFDPDIARNLASFGSKMLLSRGLESLIFDVRGFIIGTLLGTTALGYFDRGIKLVELGHTAAGPGVAQVSLAVYSRLQGAQQKLTRAFEATNHFLIRIFVLVALLVMLFGEEMTVLLYGEKWRTTGEIVPLLSVYVLFLTIFENPKSLMYSQAKIGAVVKVRAIQSVMLIVGMLLVLPKYQLVGAALVVDLVYLVGTVLMFLYAKLYTNGLIRSVLPPLAAGIIALLSIQVFQTFYWQPANGGPIAYKIALVILMYLGGLWIFERKRLYHDVGYLLNAVKAQA